MDPITALLSGVLSSPNTASNHHQAAYNHARHNHRTAHYRQVSQEEHASWFPGSFLSNSGGSHRGMASWYGNELRGHRTASGERFNPGAMTAAHRTLPMGSHVRVWHSGHSVVVRINDRGPFVRGRVMDLSRGAAASLGCSSTCSISYEVL